MLPLSSSQIPTLTQKARVLAQQGRLDEAAEAWRGVLNIERDHAVANFQLGQILFRQGKHEKAAECLDRAATARPGEAAIWGLYAQVVAAMRQPEQAKALLARARRAGLPKPALEEILRRLSPAAARTRTALGSAPAEEVRRAIAHLQAGRAAEAETIAARLRKAHPKVAAIADILANAQAAIGKPDAAERNFRAAATLDPDYAETHSNFGRFLVERGRYAEAVERLKRALELAPRMVQAMVHMGVALKRDGNARGAIAAFTRALSIKPDLTEALFELGQIEVGEQRGDDALAHLEMALAHGADPVETRIWIAQAMSTLGREEDALNVLEDVRQAAPGNPEIIATQAVLLQTLGRFDQAREKFRAAIEMAPKVGRYYRNFLTTEKLTADDPLIATMDRLLQDPAISDESRINLGFALAKAMEDSKQYDRVFSYLRPASDLMRRTQPFNFEALRDQTREMHEMFRGVDFTALDIPGRTDFAPIFVSGLPRSGTTLVEQIIASHSQVTGGGELGHARRAWGEELVMATGQTRAWGDVPPARIAAIGHEVEAQMRATFGDAPHITDKSVLSYTMIGPILASLPRARFVVVRRDPRDNLLSIYKNLFVTGKHRYSYDLGDLARYYHLFVETIDFWREMLPGRFHEIEYEALIADPETEARRLIAACGLDWEEGCLSFHENRRRVATLSVHQVRQPIYRSSQAAWKRYEADLGDLFQALGPEYAKSGSDG